MLTHLQANETKWTPVSCIQLFIIFFFFISYAHPHTVMLDTYRWLCVCFWLVINEHKIAHLMCNESLIRTKTQFFQFAPHFTGSNFVFHNKVECKMRENFPKMKIGDLFLEFRHICHMMSWGWVKNLQGKMLINKLRWFHVCRVLSQTGEKTFFEFYLLNWNAKSTWESGLYFFFLINIVKINCDSTENCILKLTKESNKNFFLLPCLTYLSLSATITDTIKPQWNRFQLGDSLHSSNAYFDSIALLVSSIWCLHLT